MKKIGWKKDTVRNKNFTIKISGEEELFLKLEAKRTGKTITSLVREGYIIKIKEVNEPDWF